MIYEWHWDFLWNYILRWDEEQQSYKPNLLLKGLTATFGLVIWSMLLASIIGIVMGIMRTSSRIFFRTVSRLYVEFIRNMPPVVFIFVFFFFLSSQFVPLLGIDRISVEASPRQPSPYLKFCWVHRNSLQTLFQAFYALRFLRAPTSPRLSGPGFSPLIKGNQKLVTLLVSAAFRRCAGLCFPRLCGR